MQRVMSPLGTEQVDETRHVLTGLARGLFGELSPALIADHLAEVTRDADWAVRRAALQALARRYRFAARDELRVCDRPAGGALLGSYGTSNQLRDEKRATKKGGRRPYVTALLGFSPLRVSCACADFVRSSLGLCKHGLVVLETLQREGKLESEPSLLARAAAVAARPSTPDSTAKPGAFNAVSSSPRSSDAVSSSSTSSSSSPVIEAVLGWRPQQPLQGSADRLTRLTYELRGRTSPLLELRDGVPPAEVLDHPQKRLAWIEALQSKLQTSSLFVEPAVETLLSEERERARGRARERARIDAALASLQQLSRTLYPYQREGVKRFFECGRLLLADDMGLGKTTQAIAACHGLSANGEIARGLVIAPNALKPQWRREWEATTTVRLQLVEGTAKQRMRTYRDTKSGFLLIGYEQLVRDLEGVQAFAPEMVVLDEAQRIKNWATKSAAYVKALSPDYRLVLTGTPMENRLDELASIMDFVDDIALEPKWRLTAYHGVTEEGSSGLRGAKNLDVLRERLSVSMLRRVRADVLAQLPARVDTRVPVELSEIQREAHDELRRPIAELAARGRRRALSPSEFMRLMQLLTKQRMICNGMLQLRFEEEWPRISTLPPTPSLLEGLFAPKLSALRTLIEQIVVGQRRKAVVFSQWRTMLRGAEWAIRDLLEAEGMRAVFFTGAESTAQRERAIADFHDDAAVSVMFLSDAGGVGLNLQRAASCCVNLELPWNPAVLEQRIGRIYRLGQELPVDVYNLVSEEGIEGRIAGLLDTKRALFDAVFDGSSDAVRFDGHGSFMESVHKLVDPADAALQSAAEGEDDELPVDEAVILADVGDATLEPGADHGATRLDERVEPRRSSDDDTYAGVAELSADPGRAGITLSSPGASGALPVRAAGADNTVSASTHRADLPAALLAGSLDGSVTVEQLAGGRLRIEAPALAPLPLADLLESMVRSLRGQPSSRSE
jgi:superfamily II DNA or RNA helicase